MEKTRLLGPDFGETVLGDWRSPGRSQEMPFRLNGINVDVAPALVLRPEHPAEVFGDGAKMPRTLAVPTGSSKLAQLGSYGQQRVPCTPGPSFMKSR